MSLYSVQINFELTVPMSDYLQLAQSAVPAMQGLPGLAWKLWLVSDDGKRAGGLYLFGSRETAEAYAHGPYVQALKDSPAVRDFSLRVSPVHSGLSAQTSGALLPLAAAS